jgi:hypothetical protein
VLYTRGNILFDQGKIAEAREAYLAARDIFQERSVKEYLCECLGDLAKLELAAGDFSLARQYGRESRQLGEMLERHEYLSGLEKTDSEIALALGEMTPQEYEAGIAPLVHRSSVRLQVEMLVRLWRVTGKPEYSSAAREAVLSRPNWRFRKDYREWMAEIDGCGAARQ